MSLAAWRNPATLMSVAVAVLIVTVACDDLFLRAAELEITPNPAQPGDTVVFVFKLAVVPEQSYSIVALINNNEHRSVDGFEAVDGSFVMTVGAADDLITQYGLGTHTGHVEVRLSARNRSTRTADASFVLEAAPPP